MIDIKRIDDSNQKDILLGNEPFTIWGRMIPSFDGSTWSYLTEAYDNSQVSQMVFPDEAYDFTAMKEDSIFVGAYNALGKCIGLALYKHKGFKYLYLEDLKVDRAHRGLGIGKLLVDEGKKIAQEHGYKGIYTIGQDNNLSACLFYIQVGFFIGGLNTQVYAGTNQANKRDIYFYLNLE